MWSAAVFDPAFPGRSSTASGSPVPAGPWSTNAVNGWNPYPASTQSRTRSLASAARPRLRSAHLYDRLIRTALQEILRA